MKDSVLKKFVQALYQVARHNANVMVKPELILWPDPERQWESVIPSIQKEYAALMIFGKYQPDIKQGPAIWIKCSRLARNHGKS